jgi:phosphoenolpyruvate-protein phosphotransferase
MKQIDLTIHNSTGLHARPAKVFVNLAKQFKSDIRVEHGGKKANAKSLISMLTLGAERGSEIRIVVDGEDEDVALAELQAAVFSGLGEGGETPAPSPSGNGGAAAEVAGVSSASTVPDSALSASSVQAISAAPGIAIGPVFQLKRSEIAMEDEPAGEPAEEQIRLQGAIDKAHAQLHRLYQQLLDSDARSEAAIFEVHLELLDDADLLDAVVAKIRKGQGAAQAWQTTIEIRSQAIASLKDPLLSARAADLHDIGYRVLRILLGADEQSYLLPEHPVIVIARDLSPSDTASLDRQRVLGFCTAAGGPTSHTSIIARALSLPAVVSAGAGVLELEDDTTVILDGEAGTLQVNPTPQALEQAQKASQHWQVIRRAAAQKAFEPAVTLDGFRVEVVANIGGLADAEQAVRNGAEGVGLLRTEFLFLGRNEPPSEREQVEVYSSIARVMRNLPVIIRTLDIGGDKPLPYVQVPPEENPFLGERGIRLCLNRPELFREQLRAILRSARFGHLRIMFPMIADISEWRAARAMVAELRAEMEAPPVDLGIMIEVPSAALMADAFAPEIDFFSIGTNDLTQYTLAMDRMHPTLASKSDGLHPAVLRLIARTVEAAHNAGKWVGVCGELGADPVAVPVLVGLGVDELSVSVPAIPTVKAQIRNLALSAAQSLAQRALNCDTAAAVRQVVRDAALVSAG